MASLLHGFAKSAVNYPTRAALHLGDRHWTYEALADKAATIAEAIDAVAPSDNALAGVFASASLSAYSAIIGILAAGRGYVPIHPTFPPRRVEDIVERSGVDVLIVDQKALEHLDLLLRRSHRPMAVIAPEFDDLRLWARRHRRHRFISASALANTTPCFELPEVQPDDTAYLLFTSGSTGQPKGVPVSHRNARAYVDYICHAYGLQPDDRTSQTFKLAFDLSVHDLFTTWSSGACLYALSKRDRMAPGRFIRNHELTRWFSVPTMGMTMDRFHQLAPGAFPSLRTTLFCGEPLPASLAEKWAQAAPNSSIHNLYGPTEATIAITSYRWRGEECKQRCRNGVVPLGQAFPEQQTLVLTDDGTPAAAGERGELLLSGTQLSSGYWKAPQLSARQFITLDETGDKTWYRTGDRVEVDPSGCLHFLGRLDDQVQIQGHRVELAEIDDALRRIMGHDLAISVAWPSEADEVGGVVGFVASDAAIDESRILNECRRQLPDYMVPSQVIALEQLPRNTSGKLNRKALINMLENGEL